MRVFVTGGSGWIGSAMVPRLIGAGHEVVGLARSDAAAGRLEGAGARVVRGDIDDLDVLRAGAADSDGVIQLAFRHDIAFQPDGFARAAESEGRSIQAIGDVLAGSDRPFVFASGTPAVPGRASTESDPSNLTGPAALRGANATAGVVLAERGVRSSVVRLPRSVHGEGDRGFIARLIAMAREKGVSGYVGDGSNRWPAVHVFDAADLFCLAFEKAAPGMVLHAVGDEGVATREIAEVIGRRLNVPTASMTPDQLGFLGMVMAHDQPASSAQTQAALGWRPAQPGLIADMEAGHYFVSAHAAHP
jgi:nucleoside-diphosphate-sugar epimerase